MLTISWNLRVADKVLRWIDLPMLMARYIHIYIPFDLEHAERPFFRSLVQFMQSGPVVPMVWEGENIVQIAR